MLRGDAAAVAALPAASGERPDEQQRAEPRREGADDGAAADANFTISELQHVLGFLKNKKAPGIDEVRGEFSGGTDAARARSRARAMRARVPGSPGHGASPCCCCCGGGCWARWSCCRCCW